MKMIRILAIFLLTTGSVVAADERPAVELKKLLHVDNREFPLEKFRPTRSGQSNWSKGESWTLLEGAGYVRPLQAGPIAELSVRLKFPALKEGEAGETRFGFVFADGQIGLLALDRKQTKKSVTAEWRARRVRETPAKDSVAREIPVDGGLKDGTWKLAVQYGAATVSFAGKELGRACFETHDAPIVGVTISQEASSVDVLDLLLQATDFPAALSPAEQALLREAQSLNDAGGKAYRENHFDVAIEKTKSGLEKYRELHKVPHANLGNSLYNVAVVLRKAGKAAESEKYFEEAIRIRTQLFGSDHPDTALLEMELAGTLVEQKKLAAAVPHCVLAQNSFAQYFGEAHPLTETTRKLLEHLPQPAKSESPGLRSQHLHYFRGPSRYRTTSSRSVTSPRSMSISCRKTSCINSQRSPTASRGTITRKLSVASRQVAYTQWLVLMPVTISVSTPRPVSISWKFVPLKAEA